jgi:hypothetical protein
VTPRTNTIDEQRYLDRLRLAVDLRRQGYYNYALEVATDLARTHRDESSVYHTIGQILTELGWFSERTKA